MQLAIKIGFSLVIILAATFMSRKFPSMAGLIAVMPLTGGIALVLTCLDNKGNFEVMEKFTQGALWGILPSILFFLVAYLCFRKNLSLAVELPVSFSVWFAGAFVHLWLLR